MDELSRARAEIQSLKAQLEEQSRARKRMRRMLADRTAEADEALGHLHSIIESLADGLMVSDEDGRIRLMNRAWLELTGADEDILGKPLQETMPAVAALAVEGRQAPSRGEIALSQSRIGVAAVSPVSRDDGSYGGAVAVLRDVSRERELERLKSEFIANISHELRTPLTAITGFVALLEGRFGGLEKLLVDPPARVIKRIGQTREGLTALSRSSERLASLVDTLIDYSTLHAGNLSIQPEPVDLSAEITRLAARSERHLDDGLTLTLDLGHAKPVWADPLRVRQIIAHLLDNAMKFTEAGEIVLRLSGSGDGAHFSVLDSGPGLPSGDLDAVFERFRQLRDSLTAKPSGFGLGLPFCREVVEMQGGKIWAENAPGGGAHFHVTLPYATS
ncbi:MAG: PAS domain-containing protein [Proteobacteria bacterium]|nr:PAS domain-containing protein [Pseudomonadota bacterium]